MARRSSYDDQQREVDNGVPRSIEEESEALLGRSGWGHADFPSAAASELLSAAESYGLQDDAQTGRFIQFVSLATNFASASFTERLRSVPALVKGINELAFEVWKEVKDCLDLADSFKNLIDCFTMQVKNAQHNARMAMPLLEGTVAHLEVLGDVFSSTGDEPLNEQDRTDLGKCIDGLNSGIVNLKEFARSRSEEAEALNSCIMTLKQTVESRKCVVEGRLRFRKDNKLSILFSAANGAGVGIGISSSMVASAAFGGTGALVIAGIAFPPIAVILGAVVLGGIVFGGLVLLVTSLWDRHQYTALRYLTTILKKLAELSDANTCFLEDMRSSEESATNLSVNMNIVKNCVESVRYRKCNAGICDKAIESTRSVISCLAVVSAIDISHWDKSIESSFPAAISNH